MKNYNTYSRFDIHGHGRDLGAVQLSGGGRHVRQHVATTKKIVTQTSKKSKNVAPRDPQYAVKQRNIKKAVRLHQKNSAPRPTNVTVRNRYC